MDVVSTMSIRGLCHDVISYLILRIKRDDTRLMRTNNRLASFHNAGTGFALQLVCDEQEQETALQQVDAEEERHEAEVGIVLQDIVDGFSSRDCMRGRRDESLG